MKHTIRQSAPAALILTIALVATGCTTTKKEPLLDAQQASDQMQSLVRDTMDVAGNKWTSMSDGPSPDECTTPDGTRGVSFSWDQLAEGVDDPRAVMERVNQAWQDKGLATRTQSVKRADGKILHRVGSQDKVVDAIQFSATTSRMTIAVQSLCGTGNVDNFTQR